MRDIHYSLLTAGLAAGVMIATVPSAGAFEIFGVQLWGGDDDEDEMGRIEISDPLPYTVTIQATGVDDAQSIVESASSLWKDREQPAAGKAGLVSKGRGDYRRILSAFYAEGYYDTAISIETNGAEFSDLTLSADIPPNSNVVIRVNAGGQFTFGRTEVENAPVFEDPDRTPAAAGFETGEVAIASGIGSASAIAVEEWRRQSRAKAQEIDRTITANHETQQLDVTVTLDPGPQVRNGPVSARGNTQVDEDFIIYMTDLEQGKSYDPEEVTDARNRLADLGVFSSIRLEESEYVAQNGEMPYVITVEDMERRGIGLGGTYSTIDGLGLSAYWLHRNLFGRAEQLRFDASIEGLGTTNNWEDYDYNFGVSFTKPGMFSPRATGYSSLVASQLDYENYRQTSITARAGLSWDLNRFTTGDLYGFASKSRYRDDFGTRDFLTFGLEGRGEYDRRDNEFDATKGYYLLATLQPFYEVEYGNTAVRGTLEGRIFKGFGEDDRKVVLAGRAKVGSFYGAPISESPPDLLFFAGGGGSVRGYEYQSIGVQQTDADGDTFTTGGRSLMELSGEVRYRINDTFGAVAFTDAGYVDTGSAFDDVSDLKVGTGLGVRYYTGFGPLRLDVAVPLDKDEDDDEFGVYIGIGQAF